jgi:CubicO group peptidase (beta-lactamase class C family)
MASIAAGLAAHSLCSATFVSGIEPEAIFREQIQPMIGPPARLIAYRIDRVRANVTTRFAGVFRARADFSPGFGCRLVALDAVRLTQVTSTGDSRPDRARESAPVMTRDPSIRAAIERLFMGRPGVPTKNVKAVVVVSDGEIVGERYAPGYGVETPLLGWSIAKSFTNALSGILVRQGRLDVRQRISAPEWSPYDPRAQLTVEDLLRMRSGLDAEENGSGFDPVSRMEFVESDMARFAAGRPLKEPPGRTFEYTSANTLILNRLIGHTVGGGPTRLRSFADRELFEPLGMGRVTMEFDGAGTFVGSSFIYATARDYARFGRLFVDDGVAPSGRRILPEEWVDWSRRSTLGAPYGAGFWTNDGGSRLATLRIANGFPADGFFASGVLGQRIYIVPSSKLVVARFGYSRPPDFGISDDIDLIATAIRATRVRPTGATHSGRN